MLAVGAWVLLVLRLTLSVGGDLVALGVLAEGTASVVLVYVAVVVRARGVVVSA